MTAQDISTIKSDCKAKLALLVKKYNSLTQNLHGRQISEETTRVWINDLFGVFGWDVRDVGQVLQEVTVGKASSRRLARINSKHRRPDYTLLHGRKIKTFLDAKAPSVDIFADRQTAFQIRSYGWSAQVPCAFVSNFRQLAIFDTRDEPSKDQDASHGVIQVEINEYIQKFDILFEHLWRGNIESDGLGKIYDMSLRSGVRTLDVQFMGVLSRFRLALARELAGKNDWLLSEEGSLNYYVQVILDRILFIRICEARGLEADETLRGFQQSKKGFWREFQASCSKEFYNHYDGAMFDKNARFARLVADDASFSSFIDELYYPSPYRFDVMPPMIIARIYEEFLGKRLIVRNGGIVEETKGEYIRTNGAIPTPEHIVRLVCRQTFFDMDDRRETFSLKILDPCCGSGAFLLGCFDLLEAHFLRLLTESEETRKSYRDCFSSHPDGGIALTFSGRRLLISRCLFGIDVDAAAVEVAKMSLALKVIDGSNVSARNGPIGPNAQILRDIGDNIKLGNSLVPFSSRMSVRKAQELCAFDPARAFPRVFCGNDPGFTHIVCNPPYVETKYFKEAQPSFHEYLSNNYSAYQGKADLAVLFLERCLSLLSREGRAGFIVQRRWFKTEYGAGIRRIINDGKHLETLVSFEATDVFPGRITYVAVMVLTCRPNGRIRYAFIRGDGNGVRSVCQQWDDDPQTSTVLFREADLPSSEVGWDFDSCGIADIYEALRVRFGAFGDFPGLSIKDGIQALWKKIYHLHGVRFSDDGIAVGTNGFGEVVRIEKDILRGVVYNREFYPFKDVAPDAWCIFPYEGASSNVIVWPDLKHRYPLACAYLQSNERRIKDKVECRPGDRWHSFTREHNHSLYNVDKIVIPMTARDTIATFVSGGNGLYMDNANVWFVQIDGGTEILMKSVAAIINSTVFSVLAKQTANPQSGGYYKFNKQFLAPVPFPSAKLRKSDGTQKKLARLHDQIKRLEAQWDGSNPNQRALLSQYLANEWQVLDSEVEKLYGLTPSSDACAAIRAVGRAVDRVELLP